jgi:hypothetical protein
MPLTDHVLRMLLTITGDHVLDLVIVAVGLTGSTILFKILYAVREAIGWWIRALFRSLVAFVAAVLVTAAMHVTGKEAALIAWFCAAIAIATVRRRSRHVRASVKRYVIARDLKGIQYDPQEHHIDHVWPYSRGGSGTIDNLRVIARTSNLRKGARPPRLRDLF